MNAQADRNQQNRAGPWQERWRGEAFGRIRMKGERDERAGDHRDHERNGSNCRRTRRPADMTSRAARLQQDAQERRGKAAKEGTDGGKLPRDFTNELRVLRLHGRSVIGRDTPVKNISAAVA